MKKLRQNSPVIQDVVATVSCLIALMAVAAIAG